MSYQDDREKLWDDAKNNTVIATADSNNVKQSNATQLIRI